MRGVYSLAIAAAACGSRAHDAPAPTPAAPADADEHGLHTVTTREPAGSHIVVSGHGVALAQIAPQALAYASFTGTIELAVDVHLPDRDGQPDFSGATGDATLHCSSGVVTPGLSLVGAAAPLAPAIAIAGCDAHVVFAEGVAKLVSASVDANDVRVDATGEVRLWPKLEDADGDVCLHFIAPTTSSPTTSSTPIPPPPGARIAELLARADIVVGAKGADELTLGGRIGHFGVSPGCFHDARAAPRRHRGRVRRPRARRRARRDARVRCARRGQAGRADRDLDRARGQAAP